MIRCAIQAGGLPYTVLVFFGGIAAGLVFLVILFGTLYLMGRAIRKISLAPGPRTEETEEAEKWRAHPFYPVSKRARAAYLVLCFEEVLTFHGQALSRWKWMRNELWSVTRRWEEDWAARVCDLLPVELFSAPSYGELIALRRETVLPGYSYSEAEWDHFRSLYEGVDEAVLEQLAFVLSQMIDVILFDCGESETPHTPGALRFMDETQAYLQSHGIPLPQDAAATAFLMKQRHPHSGKPFQPPVAL